MNYGFVYMLINRCMPGIYKLGCTERSPHARAEELSKASGVPAQFLVLCYIEVADFQRIERELHQHLAPLRVSAGREFFNNIELGVAVLWWHPDRLSFVEVNQAPDTGSSLLRDLLFSDAVRSPMDLPDPYAGAVPTEPPSAEPTRVVGADDERF